MCMRARENDLKTAQRRWKLEGGNGAFDGRESDKKRVFRRMIRTRDSMKSEREEATTASGSQSRTEVEDVQRLRSKPQGLTSGAGTRRTEDPHAVLARGHAVTPGPPTRDGGP